MKKKVKQLCASVKEKDEASASSAAWNRREGGLWHPSGDLGGEKEGKGHLLS